ncbi:MAG TPA: MATE family efflux transporter [Burkholderiaceae bacterium]
MSLPRPRLFSIAWPLFLEMLLGIGVGIVATGMAGHLSTDAGAAFAMGTQLAATLFLLFRIIGAGVSVVITQSLGAGRREQADAVARAALGASSWIGGFSALMALLFAHQLLRLLNTPEDVLPLAEPLLRWLAPAILLDVWNASMVSVMRAHMRSRDTLAVIVVMQAIVLLLAVPLMPMLGLPGYALALFVSRLLGLGLHLWLWRWRLGLKPSGSDWWRLPRQHLAPVLHIGVPGAGENIAYRLCFMVSVAAVGSLGTQALATHAYTQQLMYVVLLFGLSIGFASEIMVGHMIGAGQLHAAHRLVRRALGIGLVASVLIASSFALASPWLLRFFTQDEQIIKMGVTLMWCTVVLEPGRSFNLIVINALRAAGDARFPVMAGALSMLFVLAGGSWLLGVHFGLGLVGVWIAYAADEWIRGLMMWQRWRSHGWVRHARATHRRVRARA